MQEKSRSSSVTVSNKIPKYAPDDPLDGRKLGEWRSTYMEPDAKRGIKFEAIYLACLLLILPISLLTLWIGYPKFWLNLSDQKYEPVLKYGLAWFSGVLGGTLFGAKWLYHSVARKVWHMDRRLWRLFTPHLSGGLAFAVIALISSGIIRIFDSKSVESRALVVGVAFMVGYFSDSAIAKLAEIAETLFGASRDKEKHKEVLPPLGLASTEKEGTCKASDDVLEDIPLKDDEVLTNESKITGSK